MSKAYVQESVVRCDAVAHQWLWLAGGLEGRWNWQKTSTRRVERQFLRAVPYAVSLQEGGDKWLGEAGLCSSCPSLGHRRFGLGNTGRLWLADETRKPQGSIRPFA